MHKHIKRVKTQQPERILIQQQKCFVVVVQELVCIHTDQSRGFGIGRRRIKTAGHKPSPSILDRKTEMQNGNAGLNIR
jgi:hypothetical protein